VLVLVDADPTVYRAAFACEEKLEDGHVLPLPDLLLEQAVDSVIEKIVSECKPTKLDVVLSGTGNYRDAIAKARPYKGNRTRPRPYHWGTAREWLQARWQARVVNGIEADDEISIRAHALLDEESDDFVIATIDKDLDQIPGRHYDYRLHVHYYVHPDEARLRFWCQALAGDLVDNIPGVEGVGFATAEKMLRPMLASGATDLEVWRAIQEAYVENGQPEAQAEETAQLVYLLQKHGEMWRPPT
jgi:DNA polymerase I